MDISYLLLLQSFRNATGNVLNPFFLFITRFGDIALSATLALVFYYAIDKELGSFMLLGDAFSLFLNGIIKTAACVYRPWVRDARVVPPGDAKASATGYSFPSGHTTIATAIYGSAAFRYRKQKGLFVCFVVFLALIMFSRNYLGVHTPQDVICGFALTVLMLVLLSRLLRWADAAANRDGIVVIVSLILSVIAMVWFAKKTYPMDLDQNGKILVSPKAMQSDAFFYSGMFLGSAIGWLLERRFVRFSLSVDMQTKIFRCLSGILSFYGFYYISGYVLVKPLGLNAASFLCGLLTWIWVLAIHPMFFSNREKKHATGN